MSKAMQADAEQLRKDLTGHTMAVLLDSGVYRHLRFKQPAPNSWNQWFEIVTWPGNLTIHGDMGTWSFSRVEDMFTFFRSRELKINASYWCEKVTSESRFGGPSKGWDADAFKANVLSHLDGYDLTAKEKAEIAAELDEEVFNEEDEGLMRLDLADFKHKDFEFQDSWEIGGEAYSFHFLWCLYAIVWAIQQYDAARPTV